jgi:hypothetical protein
MGSGVSTLLLRVAIAVARHWARAYTRSLPSVHADARRAEIESDLWELQRDAERGRVWAPSAQVVGRLVLGAADDVWWRLEQVSVADSVQLRRTVACMVALSMMGMLWMGASLVANRSGAGGRARVEDCAQSAASPETTADLRLQMLSCAGAYFLPRATP